MGKHFSIGELGSVYLFYLEKWVNNNQVSKSYPFLAVRLMQVPSNT